MSVWSREEDRLLLLELAATGAAKERASQVVALQHLLDVAWIRRTARATVWRLSPEAQPLVENLLDVEWPEWRDALARLQSAQLPPTYLGWCELRDRERAAAVQRLPALLHQKTFDAVTGAHSKVGAGRRRVEAYGNPLLLTTDSLIRLRPSSGLSLVRRDETLDASAVARMNGGEVVITQRALLAGLQLAGLSPGAILFVENLGAYLDLEAPEGFLLVHVPGWDTALVRELFRAPPTAPMLHFGDLDPAGYRIVAHLRELFPKLQWWVPSFASEYFERHARPCDWGELRGVSDLPHPVRSLVESGRWMEQEVLAVDSRCREELAAVG